MSEPARTREETKEHFWVLEWMTGPMAGSSQMEPRYAGKNSVAGNRHRKLGAWTDAHSPHAAHHFESEKDARAGAKLFLKSEFAVRRKIKSIHLVEVKAVLVTTQTVGEQVLRPGMDIVEKIGQIPTDDYDGIADAGGDFRTVSIHNDVGGTTFLPPGLYKVKIIGGFKDYETGRIIHGRLVDPEQVEIARKAGRVHQPEWKSTRLPEGRVETAMELLVARVFDPSFVLFNAGGGCWQPVKK